MKIIIVLIVLIIVAVGAYYLVFSPNSTTPSSSSLASSVKMANFAFSPATLTIKVGTRVTWTNEDSTSHTVTSDSGSLLNSPTLAPGQSLSFTFQEAGTINYHCSIHPTMNGQIVVTN